MRRQRGSITPRQLSTGVKTFDVQYRDVQGRVTWKRGFPSRGAASAYLDTVLPEIQRGIYVRLRPITFAAYAVPWLEGRQLKPATKRGYRSLLTKHLVPALDSKQLDQISTQQINTLLAQCQSLSVKTRKNMVRLLATIFEDAIAARHLTVNPLRSRELQQPRAILAEDHPDEVVVLATDEVNTLLDALAREYQPVFYTAVMTGVRLGELRGLRWSDIEWSRKTLRVERSIDRGIAVTPKSERSRRRIDVGDQWLAAMAALRRERFGEVPAPPDHPLFLTEHGTPLDADNLRARVWLPALAKAGLPHYEIKSLRHTFASELIRQGHDIVYVSKMLGHHSPAFTLKVYAHLMPGTRRDAAAGLEAAIGLGRACTVLANGENQGETSGDEQGLTTQKSIQAETSGDG